MHWTEAEELAIAVLDMPEDSTSEEMEERLFDRFEVSFEQFHQIAEALIPLAMVAKTLFSETPSRGFAKNGAFICKQEINN